MTRSLLHIAVFLAGLAVVGWVAAGYVGVNPQALAVVLLIAACYLAGAIELQRYRRATASLSQALDGLSEPPAELADWLGRLHPSLRPAARLRIDGERAALPGPALAPYLVGLLVLLGMLGTFLGMVATLRGTGAALEGATDLQAMRAALAAPVQGLGFAFGTSVAGVAASAMLGLLAALCRRERIQAALQLDAAAATTLRAHSRAHRREETFKLMQRQADALPVLADRLQAMMAAMTAQAEALNARVTQDTESLATRLSQQAEAQHERLAAGQEAHYGKLDAAFAQLAAAAEQALTRSAAESARAAGAVIQPAVTATLEGLSREAAAWREAMAEDVRLSLARHAETFDARSSALVDRLAEQAATLARTVDASHDALQARLASQEQERLAAWTDTLQSIAATLRVEHEQAQARAAAQQQAWAGTLAQTADALASRTQAQARETLDEVGRLVEAAAQAPKAAAEAIAELRQQVSEGMARDNAMLEERARLLETLSTLLDAVNHASTEQRSAVDALVSSSADLLARVGERFTEQVESERGKLAEVAADVAGSAAEVASLGESFGVAVQRFGESNDKLVQGLERVEAALEKAGTRSDEQLAYYVAQAREVVELSVLSQQQILEAMQALGQASPAAPEAEVAP